ncbi:MAG: phenylalanine 4-monooxygenase [Gemmatimonadota bacterium]
MIKQNWDAYSAEAHEVWGLLFAKRMRELESTGSRLFLEGAQTIGLSRDAVPDLADVNRRLQPRTGWQAVPVGGFIPAAEFFASLSVRRFPTTVTVRPKSQLDYLPEPDIFHDVFGHVPLHADPVFANFLQRFGAIATRARTEEETRWMARLFWFTVEFGVIEEAGKLKVYGSGLISSAADAANALSENCEKRAFDLDGVITQHFDIDRLQDVLFVINSFSQLFDAVAEMERRLEFVSA